MVDATYRGDLRELNELNFARFDAKLEQRLAELRADMDRRFALVDARFEALEARMGARFEALEAKLVARLDSRIEATRTELLRWMFAGWSSLLLAVLGTLFAVLLSR